MMKQKSLLLALHPLDFNSVSNLRMLDPNVLVNSISTTDGSINWTKFTDGVRTGDLAGRKGLNDTVWRRCLGS